MKISDPTGQSRVRIERQGNVAIIQINNPPVNAGSIEVRRGLLDAIQVVADDETIVAAVLMGGGDYFMAGSDIREFGKPLQQPQLPAVIAALQKCPKPVIAAIHGAALGGGFELALGCDVRVALADSVVGLPEVTLGMIPGAGGTQHVARLTGVATAIGLVCSGQRIAATKALEIGLIDAVFQHDLLAGAVDFALQWARAARKRRLDEASVPPDSPERIESAALAATRAGRGRPHVVAAIAAVKAAAQLPYAEALARERSAFERLRGSNEAAALRHLFFAEREAKKVPELEGATCRPVVHIGVIGAGTMGTGIAVCFANAGFSVTLIDQDKEAIARGMKQVRDIYARMVSSGKLDAETASQRLISIRSDDKFDLLADADLVVEAVFESMEVKAAVFRRLDAVLPPGAILASNTSYLNLDELALASRCPENVVGLHFFSPAHVMRLLEVVRGERTSDETLARALAVASRLRKISVVARVGEGFIGNRIYSAYRRQCEYMLEEGAYPEEIDAALEKFGFPMGPFAVGDMSGLDIAWRMRQRRNATRDLRVRYVDIPDRLCEQGRFGQKTGAGWYRYEAGSRKGSPDPEVRRLIEVASAAKGITRRSFTAEQIQQRVLITMVNEATLILEEKIAFRPSDIDLVMVNGYGFPSHEGGPLFWASRQHRDDVLFGLEQLADVSGYGFRQGDVAAFLK